MHILYVKLSSSEPARGELLKKILPALSRHELGLKMSVSFTDETGGEH